MFKVDKDLNDWYRELYIKKRKVTQNCGRGVAFNGRVGERNGILGTGGV